MNKFFGVVLFCTSFFSYAAEKQNTSPRVTRGRGLGDTGAERVSQPSDIVRRRASSSPRFNPQFLREEALIVHEGALKPNPGVKLLDSIDKK